jgi:hypothetical protein
VNFRSWAGNLWDFTYDGVISPLVPRPAVVQQGFPPLIAQLTPLLMAAVYMAETLPTRGLHTEAISVT